MTGWIRRELMAAAARSGHFGRAHLLRLDLMPAAAATLPTPRGVRGRGGAESLGFTVPFLQ